MSLFSLNTLLVGALLELMIARRPPTSMPPTFLEGIGPSYQDAITQLSQKDLQKADNFTPFLAAKGGALDVKLAASIVRIQISAFEDVASIYAREVYKMPVNSIQLESLRADELLPLGVLVGASTRRTDDLASHILDVARRKAPQSFTIAMTRAMMRGAERMKKGDACAPALLGLEVLRDGKLTIDMKQTAIDAIFDALLPANAGCSPTDR